MFEKLRKPFQDDTIIKGFNRKKLLLGLSCRLRQLQPISELSLALFGAFFIFASYYKYYLQVMFEFESLATISAFEAPKDGGFIVGDHMTLKSVDVGEIFLTHLAPLKINTKKSLLSFTCCIF